MLSALGPVEVVTYRQREDGRSFLADLLREESLPGGAGAALWIVSWGFDVPWLLRQLKGRACAYHAHSSGYGFSLPAGVPVLAVSRNTLGYWGDRAPRNPLWLVPNALSPEWLERGQRSGAGERSIDVLVQMRKNSAYVLKQLVPALQARGLRVEVQSGWVDDLVDLFNSAKVVLYDSADYWRGRGVTEGFGLPPLEALACGCVVFSSFNHALADTLDPGRMGHQLGSGTLASDLGAISAAVQDPVSWRPQPADLNSVLAAACETELLKRWRQATDAINQHWDQILAGEPALWAPARWTLRLKSKLRPIGLLAGRWRP